LQRQRAGPEKVEVNGEVPVPVNEKVRRENTDSSMEAFVAAMPSKAAVEAS
jgi:hypothetical protein